MKKYGGVITNWQIHNLSSTQDDIENVYPGMGAKPMVFTGTVLKDSDRWEEGFHMKSSLIVDIDRKSGIIETLNTRYDVVNEGNDIFPDMGDSVTKIFY